MNERIEVLALQAFGSTIDNDPILVYEAEKFAQLIVRECLNQCYNRGMNDELYNGQLKAAAYIEQHFGVKE
jgi:hypothetical protein